MPEGGPVVYGDLDPASGKTGLFVRDMNGPERFLVPSDRPAFAWLDADRVLVDPVDEQGIVHAIDTRTGADQIVFAPPPSPTIKADSDVDYFKLSGDLRWAIFIRANADGARVRQDLFDVARQSYVPNVTLGLKDLWLAPIGER